MGFKGGIRGLKSFNKALVPSKEVDISPAYNGLQIQEAVSVGASGGYAFDPKSKCLQGGRWDSFVKLAPPAQPISCQWTISIPPENARKPLVFWRFQEE